MGLSPKKDDSFNNPSLKAGVISLKRIMDFSPLIIICINQMIVIIKQSPGFRPGDFIVNHL